VKTYYTPKELAGLPGLPSSFVSVIRMAERENWPWQKRAGRGGGREYALSALPSATQQYLQRAARAHQADHLPVVTPKAQAPAVVERQLPALAALTGHQAEVMHARMWFVRQIEQGLARGMRLGVIIEGLVRDVEEGRAPASGQAALANDRKRKAGAAVLSGRSIQRFWDNYKAAGFQPQALAPNDADAQRVNRDALLVAFCRDFGAKNQLAPPTGVPVWLPWFLTAYRQPQKPSIADALRAMGRSMPADMPLPSYDALSRVAAKIPEVYLERGRRTGAELRSIMGFNRRDFADYDPFTVGQIDGHSFKAYVAHPVTGAHFHPEVCGIIDMTTKMITGYSAGLAESSRTVADAFRHSCTVSENKPVGGRFLIIEADLGSGNKAKVNADKEIGLFARVGTKLEFPEVAGNPQGHGGIERSNQSLWIRAAKELPTYTGKDMDKVVRKRIYTRLEQDLRAAKKAGGLGMVEKTSKLLLSWREFLAALEIWVAEYNNTPHRALPKITDEAGRRRHRSPNEEYAHRINLGWDHTSVHVEQELPDHLFMPHERVRINRCEFRLHGNRYHSYSLEAHHGEEMLAAYDVHDANQVYVLDLDERLVCVATWNGNSIYGMPTTKLQQAEHERIEGQIKLKRRQIDLIENSRSSALITEHPEEIRRARLELVREAEAAEAAVVFELPLGDRERWVLWKQLDAQLAAGEPLAAEAENFHRSWQNSPMWMGFYETEQELLAAQQQT